jgi:hypothetical protein
VVLRSVAILLATLLGPMPARSAPDGQPRVLLLDLVIDGADEELARSVEAHARDAVVRLNGALLVTQAEAALSLTPSLRARLQRCGESPACMVEVGRDLGVDRVLAGEARRLGPSTFFSFRVADVGRGVYLGTVEEQAPLRFPLALRAAVRRLVERALEGVRRTGIIAVELPAMSRLEIDGDEVAEGPRRVEVVTGAGKHHVKLVVNKSVIWASDVVVQNAETTLLDPKVKP